MLRSFTRRLRSAPKSLRLPAYRLPCRRFQSTAAYGARSDYTATQPRSDPDDEALRLIFDSNTFWKDFSSRSSLSSATKRTGLLQNRYLTTPQGFHEFAIASLRRCQGVVEKVLKASTAEEYKNVVKDCDLLSDLLCRVMDIAEFVRMNPPDIQMLRAAEDAHALLFEYMNVLNTTPGLNEQLSRAAADPEISRHWSKEEKISADILMSDFAKSGIHLPPQQRKRFVELSNEINSIGTMFVR
ncbi:Mitochondrial intermediate peptidase, partial [Ascosphaera atra]